MASTIPPSSSLDLAADNDAARRRPLAKAYACDILPTPASYVRKPGLPRSRSPSPLVTHLPDDDTLTASFHIVTAEDIHAAERRDDTINDTNAPNDRQDLLSIETREHQRPLAGLSRQSDLPPQPQARKLCVRHQRMADEGYNLKLQRSLDALPVGDREVVSSIWSNFSSSPHPRREIILKGLLTMCCFSQISMLSDELRQLVRIDPFSVLPREVALKVLGNLDAISLCRAAQVNKKWLALADDDYLWRGICEQHIGQKCHKCGWGLPMLERRRRVRAPPSPPPKGTSASLYYKRDLEGCLVDSCQPPAKRPRLSSNEPSNNLTTHIEDHLPQPRMITRPWKDVYSERLTIERNWRRGRCTVRTLNGHTDGVMCLQFSETLQHPSFPVLITGSYDKTARIWNMEIGTEIRCLRGHTRAVRALQFDEAKLITGSMDSTMRVWNWRTGKCLRILEGHTDGIVCLNFDSNVLASGSVDRSVKIWNFRNGECFTLRGHRDWVNSVQLWDSNTTETGASTYCQTPLFETPTSKDGPVPTIDPGKMLFSASDDGSIILWDLSTRNIVRTFSGHVGQVQSLKLILDDPPCEEDNSDTSARQQSHRDPRSTLAPCLPRFAPMPATISSSPPPDYPGFNASAIRPPVGFDPYVHQLNDTPSTQAFVQESILPATAGEDRSLNPLIAGNTGTAGSIASSINSWRKRKPVLVSGSLDNTIRVWDVTTGKPITTLFGHIEGVWSIASDKLRLVSGSHDRTIKVWVREESRCLATLVGHRGAVTCLAMGDDKIVSGSDDGDIRIWSFAE